MTEHPSEPFQAPATEATGPMGEGTYPWLAPFNPPAPGALIGGYHLTEIIGAGGMGTVYLAKQEHPRRIVALKVMRLIGGAGRLSASSKQQQRRFEQEAEILGRMRHPGIAQVYDAGTHSEGGVQIPYFAMEYVPGAKPITAYADAHKLNVRRRLELFAKVCEAVQHGHNKAVVHRDLKPGNILVDAAGNPKVIDFGVARATDFDVVMTTIQTGIGQLVGTLAYMSPEQLRGDPRDIDLRSDVYALGVVLYELLCGRLPHDVRTAPMLEAARIIREDPPSRPSAVSTAVRGDLETIILKALEKDRERRYVSAEELRQDVLRYLAGLPIIARPPTVTYLLRTATRRFAVHHPLAAALFVAVFVTLLCAPAGYVLIYRVPTLNDVYARVLTAIMPEPAAIPHLEHVRIIRVTDGTSARMSELAERYGFDDVTQETWRSIRRLHGALMERLADAGPTVVGWDFRFSTATDFDADFLRGVEALHQAGIGVTVVTDWLLDAELTDEDISPAMLAHRHIRRGPATALAHAIGFDVEMAAQIGRHEPIASFALICYAATRHPGTTLRVALDKHRRQIRVACYTAPDSALPHIHHMVGYFDVRLSGVINSGVHSDLDHEEHIGLYGLLVPDEAVLAAASIDYDQVFDMEAGELADYLGGKAIIVADYREGRDLHKQGARFIHGGDINATALESMMQGDRWLVRWERPEASVAAIAMAAMLGIIVAAGVSNAHARRVRRLVVAAGLMLIACMIAYSLLRLIINPLVPITALALASELSAATLRLRGSGPL